MALEALSVIDVDTSQPFLSVVHAKQYDSVRKVEAHLFFSGVKWYVPSSNIYAVVSYRKSDRIGGFYDITEDGTLAVAVDSSDRSIIYISLDRSVVTTPGSVRTEIIYFDTITGGQLGSFSFIVEVEEAAIKETNIASSPYFELLGQQIVDVLSADERITNMQTTATKLAPNANPYAHVETSGEDDNAYVIDFGIPSLPAITASAERKIYSATPTATVSGGTTPGQAINIKFGIPSMPQITASAEKIAYTADPTATVSGGTTISEPVNIHFGIPAAPVITADAEMSAAGSDVEVEVTGGTPTHKEYNLHFQFPRNSTFSPSQITRQYALSTSGQNIPQSGWVDNFSSLGNKSTREGKFLWVKTTLTWADGYSETLYDVAYNGEDGDTLLTLDTELSSTSSHPVQNSVITAKVGTTALNTTAQDLSGAVNELATGKQDKINSSGILKSDSSGNISAAVEGEDYASPSAIPLASDNAPNMDGTASAGVSASFSRSDHVHPEDSNLRNAIDSILLESTGDNKDRTAEIVSRLQNYKKCVLGTGTFYTTGIDMPDNSSLIGSGSSTILLKTGTGSYVVSMNKNNTVSNLCIDGNTSWNDISSTIGTHHGILWNGDYSTSKDPSIQPQNGKLSNLTIQYCDGGGITCNDTGTKRYNNLIACNIAINYCSVGIYIPFYSEYHRFTNVDAWSCYYGCINNGGNNCFANCDFSDSKTIGFVIDNSDPNNVKTNNSHATCVGCSFNHIGANDGLALSLKGVSNGFTFGNCNFFRGSVEIIDSTGVEITDSLFGEELSITISNSQAIVFSEDIFQGNPTVTRTNSTDVYFNNCFNYSTGGYIPESTGDIERRIDKNVFASTVPAYSDLSAIAEYMNSKGTGSVAFIRLAHTAGSIFFKSGTGKPTLCYMLKGGPTNAYFLALTQGEASVGNFNVTNGTVDVLHDILTSESIERRYVTHAYSKLNAGANTTANLKTLIDNDLPAGYSFLAIAGYSSGNKDAIIYSARYTDSSYALGIKNSGSSQVSGTAVIDYLCINQSISVKS